MIARPIVVFPLPDSPTREKVSPLINEEVGVLTATNFYFLHRRKFLNL